MEISEKLFLNTAKGLIIWSGVLLLSLLFTRAKYGRYSDSSKFVVNDRIGWFLQELPALAIPAALICFTECPRAENFTNRILLSLYGLHYIHRIFIYPLFLKGRPLPLYMVVLAFLFCSMNGFLQCGYLLYVQKNPQNWHRHPQFIAGFSLFIVGLCINVHSDHILRNLRKPGETGYKIPQGGMFEYVSGANFLGEILEWWGFAIASNSLPGLAFAISTTCNLGPRAVHHHRWYIEKFDDYPKSRKALIPYLF